MFLPTATKTKKKKQIVPPPLVLGNASAELLQPTDIFRAKNENVRDLEANCVPVKQVKAKVESSSVGVKLAPMIDPKSAQNVNKINNNAVEFDELLVSDKIEGKLNKVKVQATPVANAMKQVNENNKANQKGTNAGDIANKSNNNIAVSATAAKNLAKESIKKKSKEKDQKAAEEKRRQQEEDEERKRLELIAAQRKAKLVDQNAVRIEQPKRNNLAASVGMLIWLNIKNKQLRKRDRCQKSMKGIFIGRKCFKNRKSKESKIY